jgi:hypothetical protein
LLFWLVIPEEDLPLPFWFVIPEGDLRFAHAFAQFLTRRSYLRITSTCHPRRGPASVFAVALKVGPGFSLDNKPAINSGFSPRDKSSSTLQTLHREPQPVRQTHPSPGPACKLDERREICSRHSSKNLSSPQTSGKLSISLQTNKIKNSETWHIYPAQISIIKSEAK